MSSCDILQNKTEHVIFFADNYMLSFKNKSFPVTHISSKKLPLHNKSTQTELWLFKVREDNNNQYIFLIRYRFKQKFFFQIILKTIHN